MNYTVKDGKYGKMIFREGVSEFEEMGEMPEIVTMLEDIDTEEVRMELAFEYKGAERRLLINRLEVCDSNKLVKYSGNGLDVRKGTSCALSECLIQAEKEYPVSELQYSHTRLGWKYVDDGGKSCWRYFHHTDSNHRSKYCGYYDVEPSGKLENWVDFVNKYACNIGLQFVLAASISSILLDYFRGYINCDNFIVHFVGDSSSGKSTALELGLSVFGNPEIGTNTLGTTWNSTGNALLKRLSSANGVTFGLDESSTYKGKDMTDLIYKISAGTDKDRLSRDGDFKEKEKGTFVVLSTGESGLLSRSSHNNGLEMRVLEIQKKQWTESAEQAEKIVQYVQKRYGLAAPAIAEWIERYNLEKLFQTYQKLRKLYLERTEIGVRKERMSSRIALILLAAAVAKKAIGLQLNYKEICSFIVENESISADTRNNFDGFYEKLKSELLANRKYFTNGNAHVTSSGEYGCIEPKQKYLFNDEFEVEKELQKLLIIEKGKKYFCTCEKYVVRQAYFNKIVKRFGYEDSHQLLKYLKTNGILDCDADRLTRKRKIGNSTSKETVYVVNIVDDETEMREIRRLTKLAKENCQKKAER